MKFVICADDYAQNADISRGIVNLLEAKKITATSCMTNSPHWPEHAEWLKPILDTAEIGLHFNLTEGMSLSTQTPFSSLGKLLLTSQLRLLKIEDIKTELRAQLDRFETALGKQPDFIDGHQHIHQFPTIRDALLRVYLERFSGEHKPYIRVALQHTAKTLSDRIKISIIRFSGAHALKRLLLKNTIPHNDRFAGSYNLANAKHYAEYFPEFLSDLDGKFNLLMCHPGLPSDDINDPLSKFRQHEYDYLMSTHRHQE